MVKMLSKNEPWYLEQRTKNLAIMYLTRRQDLTVTYQDSKHGLDLIVAIGQNGDYTGRIFGVKLQAASTSNEATRGVSKTWWHKAQALFEDTPFPIIVTIFTMEDDQGYYGWLKEPQLDENGNVRLSLTPDYTLSKLVDSDLDAIVAKVNNWYDSKKLVAASR